MLILSHGVVTRTFGSLLAACCLLFNTNSKKAIFHPKWTTGRHHSVEDAFCSPYLHSFDCVIDVEEPPH